MTLTIPEDILRASNLDERTILIELACRLYDARKLTFGQAIRLSGLTRSEFEDQMLDRHLPVYRYDDVDDFMEELRFLDTLRKPEK